MGLRFSTPLQTGPGLHMAPRLKIKGVPLIPPCGTPYLFWDEHYLFLLPIRAVDKGYKLFDYTNVSANAKFMVDARGKTEETAIIKIVYIAILDFKLLPCSECCMFSSG